MENRVDQINRPDKIDFAAGALFLINKETDWTSFDVVNKLRFALKYRLQRKKFKVGHAGTLDPLATGLLLICCGKYTKKIETLQNKNKSYTFTIKLGYETASYDSEQEEIYVSEIDHISSEDILAAMNAFKGDIDQLPPMFSAIKRDGKALYKLARQGETVELKTRPVKIIKFELINYDPPFAKFILECSKGTYIRSVAHDLGKALKVGAYVTALERTAIDVYDLKDALSVEEVVNYIQNVELVENIE